MNFRRGFVRLWVSLTSLWLLLLVALSISGNVGFWEWFINRSGWGYTLIPPAILGALLLLALWIAEGFRK